MENPNPMMPAPGGDLLSQSSSSAPPLEASPRPARPLPPPIITTAPQVGQSRRALPDRNVTEATIEQAYVDFVFYCNPGVSADADDEPLREAFRSPPRSGGKSFDIFVLYQLIRELESKELKSWTELALKLGVEPPDQEKGGSSQKIQQYAVRLKRWMHSMHVDAFFEYLMGRPRHPYWSDLPTDPDPVIEAGRDGVAPKDDMALRALLPHIRPKRGRKRETDEGHSPSQRPRLDSPLGQGNSPHQDTYGPWSAHPDGRPSPMPAPGDPLRPGGPASEWSGPEAAQTPMTAYPQSAITPSFRGSFWGDDTRFFKQKKNKRNGPKVVSSAWRSSAIASGKPRGRPPINRTPIDGQSPFPRDSVAFTVNPVTPSPNNSPRHLSLPIPSPLMSQPPPPPPLSASAAPAHPPASEFRTTTGPTHFPNLPLEPQPPNTSRPARPSISLHVPERSGGSVRLATPPPPHLAHLQGPCVQIPPIPPAEQSTPPISSAGTPAQTSGARNPHPHPPPPQHADTRVNIETLNYGKASLNMPPDPTASGDGPNLAATAASGGPRTNFFDSLDDRTNVDALYSHFVVEVMMADWVDVDGNPAEPACADEAGAIITTVIESLFKASASNESFLINVAALAGGKMLMTTTRMRLARLEQLESGTLYTCSWEYRLGPLRGTFSMTQEVSYDLFRPGRDGKKAEEEEEQGGGEEEGARYWQKKYKDLSEVVRRKDEQISDLKRGVVGTLRASKGSKGP